MPEDKIPRKKLKGRGEQTNRDAQQTSENKNAIIRHIPTEKRNAINNVIGPPHVLLQVEQQQAAAILDTGADRSLISKDLYESLFTEKTRPKLNRTQVRLKGATGHQLTVLGQVNMPFTVGTIKLTHPVQVVKDMGATFLIGNDLIIDRINIIKGRHIEIEHNGKTEKTKIEYRTPHMRVRLIKQEEIAPNSIKLVDAEIFHEEDNVIRTTTHAPLIAVEELEEHNNEGYGIEESITQASHIGRIKILLANLQEDPLEIPQNTVVAKATPILPTGDNKIPYEELATDGRVHYLHEQETRENILHGDEQGFNPIPPGYEEQAESEKRVDITQAKATSLTKEEQERLQRILHRYQGVLSTGQDDYGRTPLMSFSIETGENKPVAARYRPIPASYEKEVRQAIVDMKKNDIIEEADSAWNSMLVLVRKPNGKLRICVNLKGVNEVTVNQTNYPINQQEQSFARLCNGKFFFRLDLSQAYYAIPLATEKDRDRTAFSAFGKQYRFKVSPFGARYLPSRFNKLMTQVLEGLDHYLFYYFDDVIGCFQTADELLSGLATVLQRLIMANLRVNFQKSDFCLTTLDRIKWLGAVIHDNKICPDSEKIKAIKNMPIPTNKTALMRFVGAVNYHRRHLEKLADAAAPLNKLVSPKVPFKMGPEQIRAFETLKDRITKAPALALPDINRKFIITTDASDIGVGGILAQKDDEDQERIVAYCSRTLTANEQNGSSCEKEILAILYAVNVFHFYIANAHFQLRSDSKSLVFLRHFKDLNSKLFRASLILDELSFDIQHMSATRSNAMGVADMISRAYGDAAADAPRASYKTLREPRYEKITAPTGMPKEPISFGQFNQLADSYLKTFNEEQSTPMDKHALIRMCTTATHEEDLAGVLSCMKTSRTTKDNKDPLTNLNRIALRPNVLTPKLFQQAQDEDQQLGAVRRKLITDPSQESQKHLIQNNILCRNVTQHSGLKKTVVWVPQSLVAEVLDFYHGAPQGAHRGRKQLYYTLQQLFYWHGMAKDVRNYAQNCPVCKYQNPNTNPQATLGRHHISTAPNQTINIDIVGPFKPSSNRMKYILTVQCDFTKYVLAFPLANKDAETIAKTIVNYWVAPFGAPKYIKSDEGTDCDSTLMQYVCRSMNIMKIRTPIYSPQANPVERWHATLGRAMRTWLDESQYKEWPTVVPLIAHSYNTSVHTTTKLTPQQLFFGRETENHLVPVLPENHPATDKHRYLKQLQRAQQIFWSIAEKNLKQRQKESHPETKREIKPYQIGDYILIRNQARTNKLSDKWIGPYRIVEVQSNALHCIKWDAQTPEEYRLHHHAADMGTVVKKMVHPKDAKLWNAPLPTGPQWDEKFARKMFKGLNRDYLPSDWDRGSDELTLPASSTTTTKKTRTRNGDSTSSDSDSDQGGPPPGGMPIPHQQQQQQQQIESPPLQLTPVPSNVSSPLTSEDEWEGNITHSLGPPSSPNPNVLNQHEDASQDAYSMLYESSPRAGATEQPTPGPSNRQEEETPQTEEESEEETFEITDKRKKKKQKNISPIKATAGEKRPYTRLKMSEEYYPMASAKLKKALKYIESEYEKALTQYDREGHPTGRPPPIPVDVVHEIAWRNRDTVRQKRQKSKEAMAKFYLGGFFAEYETKLALKRLRRYQKSRSTEKETIAEQEKTAGKKTQRKGTSRGGSLRLPKHKRTNQAGKTKSLPAKRETDNQQTDSDNEEKDEPNVTYGPLPPHLQTPDRRRTTETPNVTYSQHPPHLQTPDRKSTEYATAQSTTSARKGEKEKSGDNKETGQDHQQETDDMPLGIHTEPPPFDVEEATRSAPANTGATERIITESGNEYDSSSSEGDD